MSTTYRPPRVCRHPGCTNDRVMSTGWCLDHDGENTPPSKSGRNRDEAGQERDAFYNTPAWRRIRAALKSKHPLCGGCLLMGRTRQAWAADHVLPISHAQKLIGRTLNIRALPLQSLCQECHGAKWSLEKRNLVWDTRTPPGATVSFDKFVEALMASGEWSAMTGETGFNIG